MSRNLEVLEQVQQARELFRVAPVIEKERAYRPQVRASAPLPDTDGFGHEQLLGLAQRLFLASDGKTDSGPRQVVFCGIDHAESTNELCIQLGRILASQVRSQVCVVDANIRAPQLHRLLGLEPSNGWSAMPAHAQLLHQVAGSLWLISGQLEATNVGVGVSLNQVCSAISQLPPDFAHVVINAPPVGMFNDAVLLGQKADGIVLVLEANFTRRVAARKAKVALTAANVQVLGTVLNNRTFPIPEKIYRLL
jgi:Mrp family chromosome partitioning ATPase